MQNRLYTPPPNTIAGVSDSSWPTPLDPVAPIGPQGSQPLGWNFWQGQNLTYTPRPDAEYTAHELRELAMFPLARILIEQVKDDIASIRWRIQLKQQKGEPNAARQQREADDPNIAKLNDFFEYPDGENAWDTWIRPYIDDMLTIDAASILMRRTFKGEIAELRVIPGNSITRYIDDNGFTPKSPSPAYAQLWEGIPRVNLTTDQLLYRPFNIVPRSTTSSHLYGLSPTEAMATDIKIGIERLNFVLAFYTEGSTPGILRIVPPGVTPDKIMEAMNWQNSELAGNLAKRRQWREIQGWNEDREDQVIQLTEPVLADAFDDLQIRKLAYGYGASAQRLLKMMNRAASESNQDSAEEEGTLPWVGYVRTNMNIIIQKKMGFTDYEWVPDLERESDPVKQAAVDKSDVDAGIKTRNEARVARGLDPYAAPEASMLMITTSTGAIPLEGSVDRTQSTMDNATVANKPTPTPNAPSADSKKKTLAKAALLSSIAIDSGKLTPKNEKLVDSFEHRTNRWFQTQANNISDALKSKYSGANKFAKADDDDKDKDQDLQPELLLGGMMLPPLERNTIRAMVLLAWGAIDWDAYALEMQPYLQSAAEDGAALGIDQVRDIVDKPEDVTAAATAAAKAYAEKRSAEMIGKKYDADGNLVADANAHWPLTDVMLRDLESSVTQAVQEKWTVDQLAAVIEASYALSSERAAIIAHAELATAQTQGHMAAWKGSKVITMVQWKTSLSHFDLDECDVYEEQGVVPLGHEFAVGLFAPLAHPHCQCRLEAVPQENI